MTRNILTISNGYKFEHRVKWNAEIRQFSCTKTKHTVIQLRTQLLRMGQFRFQIILEKCLEIIRNLPEL